MIILFNELKYNVLNILFPRIKTKNSVELKAQRLRYSSWFKATGLEGV